MNTQKNSARWPYREIAQDLMHNHPSCKSSMRDGWQLGMWEFIAKNGRLPAYQDEIHLIETNTKFWEMYNALDSGDLVEMTLKGETQPRKVPQNMRGMFDAFIEKRNKVFETYS